jgi:hypothetical protein
MTEASALGRPDRGPVPALLGPALAEAVAPGSRGSGTS